jgi:hypothetical protein
LAEKRSVGRKGSFCRCRLDRGGLEGRHGAKKGRVEGREQERKEAAEGVDVTERTRSGQKQKGSKGSSRAMRRDEKQEQCGKGREELETGSDEGDAKRGQTAGMCDGGCSLGSVWVVRKGRLRKGWEGWEEDREETLVEDGTMMTMMQRFFDETQNSRRCCCWSRVPALRTTKRLKTRFGLVSSQT